MPVILDIGNLDSDVRKYRTITIRKGQMLEEVDSHTCKYVDAAQPPTVQQQNAISSDASENLDGSVIAQLMEYREARLRVKMSSIIKQEEILEADNVIRLDDPYYTFDLDLPEDFPDSNLRPLAILMRRYIVWGILFDWFGQLGLMQEANIYGSQLKDIEEELDSAMSSEGYAVRPLQPFGPAYKIR